MRLDLESKMTLMSVYSQLTDDYARLTKELINRREEFLITGNLERVGEIHNTCDKIAKLLSHVENIILNSNREKTC